VSARFRPEGHRGSQVAKFRTDPPPGVRASTYYATMLTALPKTIAALLTENVLRLVRQDLGDYEAVAEWLAEVVQRRGAPVMVHVGDRTLALGPGSTEHLLGHIGVMHEVLEAEFGPIARVYRPETAA
jgi:hypothetical protein